MWCAQRDCVARGAYIPIFCYRWRAMTLASWIIIGISIVAGSFLSGVFGMAGGMVVIGVLLLYFDVATAMILFSIIQLTANGLRAIQWWSFVRWDILWLYCVGGAVAFLVADRLVRYVERRRVGVPETRRG